MLFADNWPKGKAAIFAYNHTVSDRGRIREACVWRLAGGSCLIFAVSILLSGCMSHTVINEYRATKTVSLDKHDTIVILGRRYSGDYETEHNFVQCIGNQLSTGAKVFNVIPEKHFVDSLYPYFEAGTAPSDIKRLGTLVNNPLIAKKLTELGLRYFIWVDGTTETMRRSGNISCAAGPGGGGCLGYVSWDDEANYEASIWDFSQMELSGKIHAETMGTSFTPAIIIPIPMLARVQTTTCKKLSERIKMFFSEQG